MIVVSAVHTRDVKSRHSKVLSGKHYYYLRDESPVVSPFRYARDDKLPLCNTASTRKPETDWQWCVQLAAKASKWICESFSGGCCVHARIGTYCTCR